MVASLAETLPRILPPGGAPVDSQASALAGQPVIAGAPLEAFQAERQDNPVLRLQVASGVGVREARARLRGASYTANLAAGASISAGTAQIALGGPRPVTRVRYARAAAGASPLMIQLGGAWFQPQSAGGVRFDDYASDTRFPELITEKVLLGNVASVSDVESTTLPSNVTLRLTDGGVPFFAGRGDLLTTGADVPDFGAQLAQTLQACEPIDGVCAVDLVAHSDTFGTIAADLTRIAYRAADNSLNDLPFEARTVLLPADGAGVFDLPLVGGLAIPSDRPVVSGVSLALVALGLGPTLAPRSGRRGAVVSTTFQVAQPVTIDASLNVARLHVYVQRRTRDATVTIELRADADGEPRGALLASATPSLNALPDGDFDWLPVTFDRPVSLSAATRAWILLRVERGDVEWRGDEVLGDGLAALFSPDRGNTWQAHPLSASYVVERSLDSTATIDVAVGSETHRLTCDPVGFPLALDGASPLVRGLNNAIAAEGSVPQSVPLALVASAAPLQITFTRFDVTYEQVDVLGA